MAFLFLMLRLVQSGFLNGWVSGNRLGVLVWFLGCRNGLGWRRLGEGVGCEKEKH